ncbi:MAG TPA: 50S ribosomal protein L3 [Fusobacteria bacterium]|nr:50S ribosomal protein L3 [Fusobacteriota bacterium]|tara:strand:+ start:23868 stop:24503 length:636 start_codon:yes stop_codon:yes gene_type:complete
MLGILGKKIGMSQIYIDGTATPVTVIEAGPCKIVDLKSEDKNGYSALALSFGKKSAKKTSKAMKKVFEKANADTAAIVREFHVEKSSDYEIGQDVCVDVLDNIEYIDVIGISKGKGFQGVMKRHGFSGGPASHGSTLFHRRPGSIGNFASSGRVFPGKKMPGRMGNERVTVQNLRVVRVDKDNNTLLVKGAVPGSRNGYVVIKPSLKRSSR